MSALYHALFDIYDSLIALATDLIHLHETFSSNPAQVPTSLNDLSDLLAALSLPAAPRPQYSNGDDSKILLVSFTKSFGVRTKNVKMAVKTYAELKTELAEVVDEVIIRAWVKLEEVAQSVGKLYETLKVIADEVSL